ncbi:hypothetical protein [Sporosarcina sp. OR05]|uniref:hypothetical protein n=1 Tax=Sporosarcina sp. OR05 TaxID=2969819 RepID=UPI003529E667
MKSVNPNLVFRQLLSNLPDSILACPLMNGTNKITDFSIVKLFIMANVAQWHSHRDIEAGIQSDEAFKKELGIDFISYSTISRRLNGFKTGACARLNSVNSLQLHIHKIWMLYVSRFL